LVKNPQKGNYSLSFIHPKVANKSLTAVESKQFLEQAMDKLMFTAFFQKKNLSFQKKIFLSHFLLVLLENLEHVFIQTRPTQTNVKARSSSL